LPEFITPFQEYPEPLSPYSTSAKVNTRTANTNRITHSEDEIHFSSSGGFDFFIPPKVSDKILKNIKKTIKRLSSSSDPVSDLEASNKTRKKRGDPPLPIRIHRRKKPSLMDNFDNEAIDKEVSSIIGLRSLQTADGRERYRNLEPKARRNLDTRREAKVVKSKEGASKKERNRREKQKTTRFVEKSFDDYSFEGLERKAKVKESQLQKKADPPVVKTSNKAHTKEEKALFREAFLRRKQEKRAKRMSDRAAARKGINTESGDILFPSLTGHIDAVISPAWRSYLVFLLQMYKGRDIIDHAAAIHQYLMYAGFKIDDLCSITGYNVFVSYYPELVKYWSESRDRKTTESGADTVTDFLDSVMGSELVIGMRNFLLTLAGIRFFGKEFDSTVFRVFGHQTRMSVTEFLSHLLTCLRSFLRFGQSLADGIPFTEALFAPDPVQAACEKVQYYIRRSDAVYTGLPTPGEIDLHTYMSELDKHLLFLEKSGKGMSPLSPVKKRLKCLLDEGRMVYNSKLADLYGRTRDTPFGIILHGKSGVGKGHILLYLAQLWDKSRGRDFDPSHIFPRSSTSQYWEGYKPFSHNIVHYSEVARFSENMTSTAGDSQLDEIISLVDSLTFYPDMAFGDKGKVPAFPELVIGDTNNESLNAGILYYCPEAYRRRFIFIEVIVLPEYRKENSHAIDSEKSRQGEGHILDRYTFNVVRYNPPIKKGTDGKEYLLRDARLPELSNFLYDMFVSHVKANRVTSDRIKNSELVFDKVPEFTSEVPPLVGAVAQTGDYFDIHNIHWEDYKEYAWLLVKSFFTCAVSFLISGLVGEEKDSPWVLNPFRFVLIFFMWHLGVVPFYYLIAAFINFQHYLNNSVDRVITTFQERMAARTQQAFSSAKHYVTGAVYNPFVVDNWMTTALGLLAGGAGSALTVALVHQLWRTLYPNSGNTQSSDEVMNAKYNLGAVKHKVPIKHNTKVWNDQVDLTPRVKDLPPYTYHVSRLYESVITNARFCRIVYPEGPDGKTYAFGIKGNKAVINKHALRGCSKVKLFVSTTGGCHAGDTGWRPFTLDTSRCVEVADDLIGFYMYGDRFRDVTKHFHDFVPWGTVGGMFAGEDTRVSFHKDTLTANDNYTGAISVKGYLKYVHASHESGMCGLPVLSNVGNRSGISGIHVAGGSDDSHCYAIRVSKEAIIRFINDPGLRGYSISSESGSMDFVDDELDRDFYGLDLCDDYPAARDEDTDDEFFGALCKLEEPISKSAVRYEHLPGLRYYGKLPGPVMMPNQSRLKETKIASGITDYFQSTHDGYDLELHDKPPMRPFTRDGIYYSPYNNTLKQMGTDKPVLDYGVLETVVDKISKRVIEGLEAAGITTLAPLTMSEAVNGVEFDPFIRRINASTSGGFGFAGPKYRHLPIKDDEKLIREPTSELRMRLEQMIRRYEEGRSCHPVFRGCLKDEPRLRAKCLVGKTRMFFMTPIDFLILSRMFLCPFYSLMVRFGDIFCTSVGVNMHADADRMYRRILEFSPHILEGDYGGFDLNMPHGVGEAVNQIVTNVLLHFGYNEESMTIVNGILTDNLFPYVEVLKDIYCVPGMQPSGKYATAEDNSLRGLVMLLYAWEDMKMDGDFFKNVLPFIYGDDVLASVRNPEFTTHRYADFVRNVYHMRFTTADKGDVTRDFIQPSEMSFLKRHFKYDTYHKKYVAFLPRSTFVKMLAWTLPSKFVSDSEQLLAAAVSSLWEYALYDSSTYDQYRTFLARQLQSAYLYSEEELGVVFPTLIHIHKTIWPDLDTDVPTPMIGALGSQDKTSFLGVTTESGSLEKHTDDKPYSVQLYTRFAEDSLIYESKIEMEALGVQITSSPYYNVVFNAKKPLWRVLRDSTLNIPRDFCVQVQRYMDLKSTIARFENHRISPLGKIVTESGELESGAVGAAVDEVMENFRDVAGDEEKKVDSGHSLFPDIGQQNRLSLDEFFARPVEIDSFILPVGGNAQYNWPIWDLYSLNPSIRAKLRNYAYFTATLHVRVAISGSPFHYGRVLLSYQPFAVSNPTLVNLLASTLSYPGMRPLLINYLSQAPGSVTMDVKSNKPVDMEIPFISTKPLFRLYNDNPEVISSSTSFADFEKAGALHFITINPTKSTSTTPSNPRVQIFAWATNVQLGTTTATQLAIATESGNYDERDAGPVERFSSAAVQVSDALKSVPIIEPFATASSYVFHGVRTLSSIFGWSKPVVVGEPTVVKNEPFQNGAHVIGSDTAKRITLDPKQELPVDPRIVGVSTDDMVISELASRSTYLTTFTWPDSAEPMVPIWKSKCHPTLCTYSVQSLETYYQPTACAFAVAPFTFWNGKMVFKFEFVSSAFHRGKIAVLFEPNISQSALIESGLSTNKQYMIVVDIQETQTFEICVDWARPRYWCLTEQVYTASYSPTFSRLRPDYTNGYICVFPFTSLQSNDNSDIEVNVYVRCDDLRVNYLSSRALPEARGILSESGVFTESGDYSESSTEVTCFTLNESSASMMRCSHYHFGEEPVSFRSLLKRYTRTNAFTVPAETSTQHGVLTVFDRVYPKNYLTYGSGATNTRMPLFSYLRYAYLGARGGIRKRIEYSGEIKTSWLSHIKITNQEARQNFDESVNYSIGGLSTARNEGTVTFVPHTNGGVEFELPYYSSNLFWISFADDMVGDDNSGEVCLDWNKSYIFEMDVYGNIGDGTVSVESAAAEDFSFMRFQGAPYFTA
jgi:hypothetical protein